MRTRPPMFGLGMLFLLLAAALMSISHAGAEVRLESAASRVPVDKLFVVDCLLPGQVRQLGTRMTYLSPRRAIKASAGECELRGGEYVASDRGSLNAALAIWLPQAQVGDKEAQTYVGEIYERGLAGTAPDYAAAASWYQKAADQGYARAQVNLGFLHEKGLGVKKDPAAALNLYRKASGLEGLVTLDEGTAKVSAARDAEMQSLRRELEETKKALESARKELERRQGAAQSEIQQIEKQKQQAADAGYIAAVRRLESELKQREDELNQQRNAVARLEQTAAQYRDQLTGAASESASLRSELDEMHRQLAQSAKDLDERKQRAAEYQRLLDATREDLERQKRQTAASSEESERIRTLEAQLQARTDDVARQAREVARIEEEAQRYKQQLAALESRSKQSKTVDASASASVPTIQLIDPQLVATRNRAAIRVGSGVDARDIVGKVIAPAGLLSFTVNDQAQALDENGMFKARVPVAAPQTGVKLVAVDARGKRSMLEFVLVPDAALKDARPTVKSIASAVDFGAYYALVIGNQKYQKLPRLDTAADDALAVSEVLTNRYGFKATTLIDATRYQILSELNRLRTQLTEKDNLLIYYAGHGEIDRANLRGHWLPVDAEPDSDANWISSVAITDILNAMSVKHVLVVADSCYSGAMTRSSIGQLDPGITEDARITWIKALAKARSRTVLTSGGVQPVMDGGGGKHSVFAQSFIDVLKENQDALEGQRLYREVAARVLSAASRFKIDQQPEYAPLKFAGHESGDFLFVPMSAGPKTASR